MMDIKIEDVVKINTEDGDTLLVTLPESSLHMPLSQIDEMLKAVGNTFDSMFHANDVKVVVVPHGMKVELIKSSTFTEADK